jgi:hypothetical protein
MPDYRLAYYYQGVEVGCEWIEATDEKAARQDSWCTKISFSTKLKDKDGNMLDHRKLSVKITPVKEKKEIEAQEKPRLEDKFKWY